MPSPLSTSGIATSATRMMSLDFPVTKGLVMSAGRCLGRSKLDRLQRGTMSKHECVPECPTHRRPLVCPSCLGAAGGRKKSPKKAASSRANLLEKGLVARWPDSPAVKKMAKRVARERKKARKDGPT